MTAHDEQTLIALGFAAESFPEGAYDVDVVHAGEAVFGEGWTLVPTGYSYAPLVSMSLGRLRVQGLVEHGPLVLDQKGKLAFHSWRLTERGVSEAARLSGR